MRRAVPIETVRAYVDDQLARAEAAYDRVRASAPDPRNHEWSRLWTRYAWLHWLELKALRRAERAGVGAVLALELDDLLLEQLHSQGREIELDGTFVVCTVPRDLTQDAVEAYWSAATVLSASAEGWRRYPDREILASRGSEKRERERAEIERVSRPGHEAEYRELARRQSEGVIGFRWRPGQSARRKPDSRTETQGATAMADEEIERRLWDVNRMLGGATPLAGLEDVHRHAELAACHYAAYRQLQTWGSVEAVARREQALEAIGAAREAFRVAVPRHDEVDIDDELASLRNTLSTKQEES